MRIAIVTEVWQPTVNGVVTRLVATVDQLLDAGHQVLVVAPDVGGDGGRSGDLVVRTVPTVSIPFVYGGQPWGIPLPRVGRYLADFKPDVVHVVNPASLGIAGVIAARRGHLPLVCSYHTDIASYAAFYHLGWLRPVIWWVLRVLHARAAINLATSVATVVRLEQVGVPRVRLWRRGVDLDRFAPAPVPSPGRADRADRADRTGRGDRADRTVVALYVGRLAAEKGLGALVELDAVDNLRLVVVGDGPGRVSITEKLQSARVEFTGSLQGAALLDAYRQADVFVFPSTTETLGLVLLEALACGLPVVAATSPASRELLENCPAARLWCPERPGALPGAIADLLHSATPDLLSVQARQQVAGLDWAAATANLVEHYRHAIEATLPGPGSSRRRQLVRFATVGGTNAAIDLGVFNLLVALHPTRSPSSLVGYNTVAVVLALANSYWWNSRWTFRRDTNGGHRWSTGRRRLLFAAQGVVNVAVNDLAVAAVTSILRASDTFSTGLAANVAKVTGMVAASAVSFVVLRAVVFRRRAPGGAAPTAPTAPTAEHRHDGAGS